MENHVIKKVETAYIMQLAKLKATRSKFTDREFMPTANSLIQDWNEESDEVREQAPKWK